LTPASKQAEIGLRIAHSPAGDRDTRDVRRRKSDEALTASGNPWTDGANDVRVSRRGGYLLIDGATIKIPLQLAQRIRRGASLRA
jgi:hypothetical protein